MLLSQAANCAGNLKKNWLSSVWLMFPTLKPSKSASAFHNEQNTCSVSPTHFQKLSNAPAALTEPGRTSGISVTKTRGALQAAGLYIARDDRGRPLTMLQGAEGTTALAASSQASRRTPRSIRSFWLAGPEHQFLEAEGHVVVCGLQACLCMRAHAGTSTRG